MILNFRQWATKLHCCERKPLDSHMWHSNGTWSLTVRIDLRSEPLATLGTEKGFKLSEYHFIRTVSVLTFFYFGFNIFSFVLGFNLKHNLK